MTRSNRVNDYLWFEKVLVNAETVHVGTGTNFSGLATNQDLASQNVPTGLLTRNNFRLARDSDPIRWEARRAYNERSERNREDRT